MLVSHGYAGLSMDRLAEETEFSKGTIYQHFSTKEDLVTALATQSLAQRAELFERLAKFEGRPRERMNGAGVADEVFARLHPYSFRSELIIKMANLEDRASSERKETLLVEENRCMAIVHGFIHEAIAAGDLPPETSVSRVMFALMSMVIGTHTIASNFRSMKCVSEVVNPFVAFRENFNVLLDGFGWRPLSSEWDYAETERRVAREIFADEFHRLGSGPG